MSENSRTALINSTANWVSPGNIESHSNCWKHYFMFPLLKLYKLSCIVLKYTSKLFYNFIRLVFSMIYSKTVLYSDIWHFLSLLFPFLEAILVFKVAYASNDYSKAAMHNQGYVCWCSYKFTANSPWLTSANAEDAIVWNNWYQ